MATLNDFSNAIKTKLDGKAPVDHDHDDRYYTESESNARFVRTVNGVAPDGSGNVTVSGGSGGGVTEAYVNQQLDIHVNAPTPHPSYDDMEDLTLIYNAAKA